MKLFTQHSIHDGNMIPNDAILTRIKFLDRSCGPAWRLLIPTLVFDQQFTYHYYGYDVGYKWWVIFRLPAFTMRRKFFPAHWVVHFDILFPRYRHHIG